ncbi:DUF2634 domain-containing protein [Lachnospiraceae bacterium 46-15]
MPDNEGYEEDWEEDDFEPDFIQEEIPSLTYAMKVSGDFRKDSRFVGKVDDTDAIRQAVLKILNTEKYEHEIYSWDYGIVLEDLLGMPMDDVMPRLEERITEALTSDDRIESVENFKAERTGKREIHCTFKIVTSEGEEIEEETEVVV